MSKVGDFKMLETRQDLSQKSHKFRAINIEVNMKYMVRVQGVRDFRLCIHVLCVLT